MLWRKTLSFFAMEKSRSCLWQQATSFAYRVCSDSTRGNLNFLLQCKKRKAYLTAHVGKESFGSINGAARVPEEPSYSSSAVPESTRRCGSQNELELVVAGGTSQSEQVVQGSSPKASSMQSPFTSTEQGALVRMNSEIIGGRQRAFYQGTIRRKLADPKTHLIDPDAARRRYICEFPQCGYRFKQRGDLKKHVRVLHHNERKFICTFCLKEFGERGNLNKHIMSVHHKMRPFQCQLCPSAYASADSLRRHERSHQRGAISGRY